MPNEELPAVVEIQRTRLDERPIALGLMPGNIQDALTVAKLLARSDMVSPDFRNKEQNVFMALMWGAEVGLSPFQALQSLAIINGRIAMWGDAMLALVQKSGLLEYIREYIDEDDPDGPTGVCIVKRKGYPEPHIERFSRVFADRAGLWKKSGPWQNYPQRMLQLRARGFALRNVFADVLRGVIAAEEARDIPIEVQGQVVANRALDAIVEPQAAYLAELPIDEQAEIRGLIEQARLTKGALAALLTKHENSPKGLIAELKSRLAPPAPSEVAGTPPGLGSDAERHDTSAVPAAADAPAATSPPPVKGRKPKKHDTVEAPAAGSIFGAD